MDLKKEDVDILWAIHQGGSNMFMIREAMGVKMSEEDLKKIIERLARISAINLKKEYNPRIKGYEWDFSINKDGSKAVFEKYSEWIPGKK